MFSANLHSKEDTARKEASDACKDLALQCSDASALEYLLKHVFDVFHGSEGKLTVAMHKISVLEVSIGWCELVSSELNIFIEKFEDVICVRV